MPPDRTDLCPALADSPLYLLAVLVSARRSKDRPLELLTRRRLQAHGVSVAFGDDLRPGVAGRLQRYRAAGDALERGGVMRREDELGEADVGEIATDGVGGRVECDRSAGERESLTRGRCGGRGRRIRR